jgi:hypothetical protein
LLWLLQALLQQLSRLDASTDWHLLKLLPAMQPLKQRLPYRIRSTPDAGVIARGACVGAAPALVLNRTVATATNIIEIFRIALFPCKGSSHGLWFASKVRPWQICVRNERAVNVNDARRFPQWSRKLERAPAIRLPDHVDCRCPLRGVRDAKA